MNFDAEVKKIQKMSQMELNCYEASIIRMKEDAEIRRQKAEASRINFAISTKAGQISDETKKQYMECIRALSDKQDAEKILSYIRNMKMTPAQRKAKILELKLKIADLKA